MKKSTSATSVVWSILRLATLLNSFVIFKILSMKLSLLEYGTYSQVMMVVQIATSVTLLGLNDSMNFFYNNRAIEENQKRQYIGGIFLLEITAGLVLAGLLAGAQGLIAGYFQNPALTEGHYILMASLIPMLDNLLTIYQMLYVSAQDSRTAAIGGFTLALLKTLAVILAVVIFDSMAVIFLSMAGIMLCHVVFYWIRFRRRYGGFRFCASRQILGAILKFGVPMGIYQLTNMLYIECDKLVIGRLVGSEMLAVYANCSRLLPYNILITAFATILAPVITNIVSEKRNREAARLVRLYLKLGYMSVWLLTTVTLIHSRQMISILYDDKYLVGQTIFILYILNSMVQFAVMHLVIIASGDTKFLMRASLCTLVLGLLLNVVMFYAIGNNGPAAATVLVSVLYTVLVLRKTARLLEISVGSLFDFSHMFLYLGQLAVTGAVFFFLKQLLLGWGVPMLVTTLVTGGSYCLCNLLLRKRELKGLFHSIDDLAR